LTEACAAGYVVAWTSPKRTPARKASDHLYELREAGVSIWLDTLSRELLDSGDFERLVERGVSGVTSNPAIFAKAITGSGAYDEQAGPTAHRCLCQGAS